MMCLVPTFCLLSFTAAALGPAPSPASKSVAGEGTHGSKKSDHSTVDGLSKTAVVESTPALSSESDEHRSSPLSKSSAAAPRGMPWQTEAEIAVAGVAGAALLGGGIAAAVESDHKSTSVDDAPKTKFGWSSPKQTFSDEPTAADVPAKRVPAPPLAPTPASATVSVQLYDDNEQKAAGGRLGQVVFMSVAGLLLSLGCVFLGVSGFSHYRRHGAQYKEADDEEEVDEESELEYDEELPV